MPLPRREPCRPGARNEFCRDGLGLREYQAFLRPASEHVRQRIPLLYIETELKQ